MENKKSSLLPKILQIVATVFMVIFSMAGFAAAYIVFAPDSLPKPFYLQYYYATPILATDVAEGASAAETEVPQETAHEVIPGEGIMINTGTKIINLSDPAGRKYIRITIVIELAPNDAAYFEMPIEEKAAYVNEFTAEVTNRLPVIEDAVITQISTKTFEQLYTADGKEALRLELSNLIMQRLPDFKVISVYFTEFVVE